MSDEFEGEAAEMVPVTLRLPAGLLRAYDALVGRQIYLDRESALLHGLVESWRHNLGSFHTVRLVLFRADRQEDAEVSRTEAPNAPESGIGEG